MSNRTIIGLLREDIRCKARWCYGADRCRDQVRALLTDGTLAMILYRAMQWSRRWRLLPLELIFNKLNVVVCHCIIGRGAEFGPGFVLIHSSGVVINGAVRGGSRIYIEHQVTIGAERRDVPLLGNDVFIGAGARILGRITICDGAKIGANAVVIHDVPPDHTAVGVPARMIAPNDRLNMEGAALSRAA
jgi:serine O-acetyltransferase